MATHRSAKAYSAAGREAKNPFIATARSINRKNRKKEGLYYSSPFKP